MTVHQPLSKLYSTMAGYVIEYDHWLKIIPYIYFLNLFSGFYYIIYTVLQCDLPPLKPQCGEAPGRDSNQDRAAQMQGQGHYP